jgi:hypothetical protein
MKPRYAKFTAAIDKLESMQRPLRPGLVVTVHVNDARSHTELDALIAAKVATAHAERPGYYDPDIVCTRVIFDPPTYEDDVVVHEPAWRSWYRACAPRDAERPMPDATAESHRGCRGGIETP